MTRWPSISNPFEGIWLLQVPSATLMLALGVTTALLELYIISIVTLVASLVMGDGLRLSICRYYGFY